ncbi:MAG: hypothetical protein LBG64_01470, partial [Pseudomonadales bacterium]|nr:hypothetical protein [Pseudomonadales bacterium]
IGFTVTLLIAGAIFVLQPDTHSDSTNLLRTNSILIRMKAAQNFIVSLTPYQLLFGRGLFVSIPYEPLYIVDTNFTSITAAFPDNFFLLLISFFGIPGAAAIIYFLVKTLIWCYQKNFLFFTILVSVLVSAQFNNTFFQPFVFLFMGFYLILTKCDYDKS